MYESLSIAVMIRQLSIWLMLMLFLLVSDLFQIYCWIRQARWWRAARARREDHPTTREVIHLLLQLVENVNQSHPWTAHVKKTFHHSVNLWINAWTREILRYSSKSLGIYLPHHLTLWNSLQSSAEKQLMSFIGCLIESSLFVVDFILGPLQQGRIDILRLVDANAAEPSKEPVSGRTDRLTYFYHPLATISLDSIMFFFFWLKIFQPASIINFFLLYGGSALIYFNLFEL